MKITNIGEAKIIMSNPLSRFNYFAWSTAVRLKNGRIAVGASGMRIGHLCPFGKSMISFSEDEGETYTLPAAVIDTPMDDRDAGLCTFGESGLIFTSFNNTIQKQKDYAEMHYQDKSVFDYIVTKGYLDAVDEDIDQNPYLGSTFRVSYDNGVTFGPLYKAPVTSPHGPIELKDGSIFWIGNPYAPTEKDKRTTHYALDAYKINLDGTNEYLGSIEEIKIEGNPTIACEAHAIELDDGTILAHIRVEGNKANGVHTFTIFQSESKDGGRTWSEPRQILEDCGGAPSHLMKHSSGVLICSLGFRGNPWPKAPFGIRIIFSKDNGKTWEGYQEIYHVNFGKCDLGYPSTVELNDGSLITVFYAHPDEKSPAVIMQQRWKFEE